MVVIRKRFSAPRFAQAIPIGLVSVLATSYAVAIVALFASGKVAASQAGLLLGLPVMLALTVLRPEWTILVLVVIPPPVTSSIPSMQLVAILLATLFGFLLQGRLHLGPETGAYPLIGIIALGIALKADTAAEAADRGWRAQILHLLHGPHRGGVPYSRERGDANRHRRQCSSRRYRGGDHPAAVRH